MRCAVPIPPGAQQVSIVEGLNNKIRVLQRRAYGLRDEEYLRLKVLTCMLPERNTGKCLPTRFGEDLKRIIDRVKSCMIAFSHLVIHISTGDRAFQ